MPGDHLQLWQLLLINQDIRAKLKNKEAELQRWELALQNELRQALNADVEHVKQVKNE